MRKLRINGAVNEKFVNHITYLLHRLDNKSTHYNNNLSNSTNSLLFKMFL